MEGSDELLTHQCKTCKTEQNMHNGTCNIQICIPLWWSNWPQLPAYSYYSFLHAILPFQQVCHQWFCPCLEQYRYTAILVLIKYSVFVNWSSLRTAQNSRKCKTNSNISQYCKATVISWFCVCTHLFVCAAIHAKILKLRMHVLPVPRRKLKGHFRNWRDMMTENMCS